VVGRNREIAPPDRLSSIEVGKSDRDDVVEPTVAQERGVEVADEVRCADEQSPLALAEGGDGFEQFIRGALHGW
jgi:hypothetical protein